MFGQHYEVLTIRVCASAVVTVVLLFLSGCQPSSQHGGATVFGITFDVTTSAPGAGQTSVSSTSTVDTESAKIKIRDVNIDLTKFAEGDSYSLRIRGKKYAAVKSGDKVVITATNQVTVNSEPRNTEENQKD